MSEEYVVALAGLAALMLLWFIIHRVREAIYKRRSKIRGKPPDAGDSFGMAFLLFLVLTPFLSPYW